MPDKRPERKQTLDCYSYLKSANVEFRYSDEDQKLQVVGITFQTDFAYVDAATGLRNANAGIGLPDVVRVPAEALDATVVNRLLQLERIAIIAANAQETLKQTRSNNPQNPVIVLIPPP